MVKPMLIMKSELFQILSRRFKLLLLLSGLAGGVSAYAQNETPDIIIEQDTIAAVTPDSLATDSAYIKKVLFIGDSMTGWMAERLNAYGEKNDFEVATIVWDGSTIKKWAASPKLKDIISEQNPDAIFVSLGMNELFEANPERNLNAAIENLKEDFADIPLLWIGPPSWPGHSEGKTLNDWLEKELGAGNYFRSSDLDIPRQSKSNPHPDRNGIEVWIDDVVEWIPQNTDLKFKSLDPPLKGAMSRGSTFIYKRMKETL